MAQKPKTWFKIQPSAQIAAYLAKTTCQICTNPLMIKRKSTPQGAVHAFSCETFGHEFIPMGKADATQKRVLQAAAECALMPEIRKGYGGSQWAGGGGKRPRPAGEQYVGAGDQLASLTSEVRNLKQLMESLMEGQAAIRGLLVNQRIKRPAAPAPTQGGFHEPDPDDLTDPAEFAFEPVGPPPPDFGF